MKLTTSTPVLSGSSNHIVLGYSIKIKDWLKCTHAMISGYQTAEDPGASEW
jgi:hypothetical protein